MSNDAVNIQAEGTPNPNARKFLVEKTLLERGSAYFEKGDNTQSSLLAGKLLELTHVTEVLISQNFITVNQGGCEDWKVLEDKIKSIIANALSSGEVLVEAKVGKEEDLSSLKGDELIAAKIKRILDEEIRPAVAQDGGDIIFHGFKDGIVTLHLQGACSSCPSATMTLRMGVENRLKHEIPEIIAVEQVTE